jgi:hypothetical protein
LDVEGGKMDGDDSGVLVSAQDYKFKRKGRKGDRQTELGLCERKRREDKQL